MPLPDTSADTMTISLPHELAEIVRAQVAAGEFASESDYFESKVVESILQPLSDDAMTHWINTEGVRRLVAMKANPANTLDHDDFWAQVEQDSDLSR